MIEGVQPVDGHVFDVRPAADRRLPIGMERVGRADGAHVENVDGVVVARLELVAHYRHFLVEQFLFYAHAGHALGFERQRPAQVLVRGGDRFVVIGAVVRRGAVPLGAAVGHLLLDVLAALGAQEQHVLHQVRHPGFPVAFVARAHQVRDIHRNLGLGLIGKQQNPQAVGPGVLGDALDGGHLLNALGQRLRKRRRREKQSHYQEEPYRPTHNHLGIELLALPRLRSRGSQASIDGVYTGRMIKGTLDMPA